MVTLEQIKLLESKVGKAIDIVTRITGENARLKDKLENYQKRIDELEVLIQRFKEEQGRIEDGILSALDRLSEFEAALENSITTEKPVPPVPAKTIVPEAGIPGPEDSGTLMFSVSEDNAPAKDDDSDGDDVSADDDGVPEGDDKNSGGGTVELDIF
jgi:FtsZ-binding cell division protein ZapB